MCDHAKCATMGDIYVTMLVEITNQEVDHKLLLYQKEKIHKR
jgi:hypothetical protein